MCIRDSSVITPEKENEPLDTCSKLRKENDINKTPRIRIKRVPSKQGSEAAPNWEVILKVLNKILEF